MAGRMATRLACWLLKGGRLSNEDRQLLTACLLDRLGALPLHAIITADETGKSFVEGRPLTLEKARRLKEASRAMLQNYARKVVGRQITFMAIQKGVHENVSPEQGLFAKAALWVRQEEDTIYRAFAQQEEPEEDEQERTL